MSRNRWFSLIVLLATVTMATALPSSGAMPANDSFFRTWERTERPVSDRATSRTWMWGPVARTGAMTEPYIEAPGGYREVQYFDKTRMEINNPNEDPESVWFVTNGLLATELITGRVQVGHMQHIKTKPSRSQIAGDRHPASPTYRDLSQMLDVPARDVGSIIAEQLSVDGDDFSLEEIDRLGEYEVEVAHFVPETGNSVAAPFWEFMNSSGLVHEGGINIPGKLFEDPFFATGFPISEAFWVHVPVGGEWKDVLLQCFQRRCLTYTPDNPSGWQVEAGNIGLHYHQFRYGHDPLEVDCVELNLATVDDLVQLRNIGESRALTIMDHRPFASVEDLERVPGIGPSTVELIKEQGLACIVYELDTDNAYFPGR